MNFSAMVDCSELRLGDRMALAWLAQQRRLAHGERFGVVDRNLMLNEAFQLPRYFPDTFGTLHEAGVQAALPLWNPGNLWLSATNAFARQPANGCFEHLPAAIVREASALRWVSAAGRPGVWRVLVHVLDDAAYNKARNWLRKDADALVRALESKGCEVVVLNPQRGEFVGGFDRMLAEMSAADAFVGGDTGPSHVFAMLCSHKPQLAIYPDMRRDQRKFRPLQEALGFKEPWNSLPKRSGLATLQLRPSRRFRIEGSTIRFERVGRFDPHEAALALYEALCTSSSGEPRS